MFHIWLSLAFSTSDTRELGTIWVWTAGVHATKKGQERAQTLAHYKSNRSSFCQRVTKTGQKVWWLHFITAVMHWYYTYIHSYIVHAMIQATYIELGPRAQDYPPTQQQFTSYMISHVHIIQFFWCHTILIGAYFTDLSYRTCDYECGSLDNQNIF